MVVNHVMMFAAKAFVSVSLSLQNRSSSPQRNRKSHIGTFLSSVRKTACTIHEPMFRGVVSELSLKWFELWHFP